MTRLYKLTGDALTPVAPGRLASESMIGWIAKQPDLLGLEMLVIGRQVVTDFGGRIDLLGIDGLTTRQVHDREIAFLGRQLDVAATTAEATAASLSAQVFDKTEKLENGHD